MIETTTFFWKSLVKGSCTVEEFRVSLEKKKTDGNTRNIRVTRRSQRPLPTPPRENSSNLQSSSQTFLPQFNFSLA